MPPGSCDGELGEELRRIKRGAFIHQGHFLAGTGNTVAVDFDRREAIRVDTYIGGFVGSVNPPQTAPVGGFIRKELRGQQEITYVVRTRKLTEAQVQMLACGLDPFWEWVYPPGWTPPMPATDGEHKVRLIADGRRREFAFPGEQVASTTAIIQQIVDPAWGP